MNAPVTTISRRAMLTGSGALMVAFALRPSIAAAAAPVPLPGDLKVAPKLDSWIQIDPTGKITVFSGKAELGQGIKTALIQVAAEQLNVQPGTIEMITADTGRTANEGYTAGSHSMQDSGTAIMNAAAEVHGLLLQAAATKLNQPVTALQSADGNITAPGGKSLGFGDLVSAIQLDQKASTAEIHLKDPATYTVMGKPFQRVDIPAKVTGGEAFVQDMRLPGMVHARVVRQLRYEAKLVSVDTDSVAKMPGVIKVVRDGSYLAVIAEKEWQAITAMRALETSAQWSGGRTLPDPKTIFDTLRGLKSRDMLVVDIKSATPMQAAQTFSATFHRPYGSHGSIGPSCGVAHLDNGKLTVWTHTQGVYPDRDAIAQLVKMDKADVRCIHTQGSGCYGHNGADDAAADAALLACALPGTPVRVQWMRDQEFTWEPYTPAMVTDVTASLDANNMIVDWKYGVWSNTHNERPGSAGRLMPSWALANPLVPDPPQPAPLPEGDGDRNANPIYAFPNQAVTYHFLPEMPLRISAMRGLGAYMNVFSIESFMDELAEAAKEDPVTFRLKHLNDKRAEAVIKLAAEKFGWAENKPLPTDHGRGFAFARYKNLASYAAIAVEVALDRATGEIRLVRAEVAVDSGQAVNIDGISNQMQGGVVQSASWTLYEHVRFDTTGIVTHDWLTYPIMRFAQAPDAVNIHVINRPGTPFLGAGEAAQGPTGAAIANAVYNVVKVRFREIPISADKVKAALNA